jgi:hypothetical protein
MSGPARPNFGARMMKRLVWLASWGFRLILAFGVFWMLASWFVLPTEDFDYVRLLRVLFLAGCAVLVLLWVCKLARIPGGVLVCTVIACALCLASTAFVSYAFLI